MKKELFDKLVTYNRMSTNYLRTRYAKTQVSGVEVGVFKGRNAKKMLEVLPGLRLALVDPYLIYDEYTDFSLWTTEDELEAAEHEAWRLLVPYHARIRWVKMPSVQAATHFEDSSLDFAYIDANHEYSHVLNDLRWWCPKVKDGGCVIGHDWALLDVARAVMDFARDRGLTLKVLNPVWGFPEWVIEK